MTRTKPSTLLLIAVVGAVGAVLLQILLAGRSQPRISPELTLAATLLLIGVVVVVLALPVRRATRGKLDGPIDPFYATRVLVLGKAASLSGALLSGVGVGFVLEVLTRSGSPTSDSYLRVFAMLVGAVALLVGGILAEHFCRVPPRDDDDDPEPPPGAEHVHGR